MRNKLSLFTATLLGLASFLVGMPTEASVLENPIGYNTFSGAGTAQSTTNAFYVAGNYTLTKGTPTVRYLNVSSDLANSVVQFYVVSNQVSVVNGTNAGTTNFVCSATNGFVAGDILLIKHTSSDTYERLPCFAVQNTNQIVVKYPPISQVNNGDTIWRAKPAGAIAIGAASNTVPTGAGMFIYAGQYDKPLLIEINGTSTATINAVSGDFK
jgi:hypothetical protein